MKKCSKCNKLTQPHWSTRCYDCFFIAQHRVESAFSIDETISEQHRQCRRLHPETLQQIKWLKDSNVI